MTSPRRSEVASQHFLGALAPLLSQEGSRLPYHGADLDSTALQRRVVRSVGAVRKAPLMLTGCEPPLAD